MIKKARNHQCARIFINFHFILVTWTVGSHGFAAINDPNQILPQLDDFFQESSFASAFRPKDTLVYSLTECLKGAACSAPTVMKATVESLSASEITVSQWGSDGKLSGRNTISESSWESIHRNYVRARINNVQSYGFEIEIVSFETIVCPDSSFMAPSSQCAKVFFKGKMKGVFGDQKTSYDMVLWKAPAGLAQILAYEQVDTSPLPRTIKYQILDFKRAP